MGLQFARRLTTFECSPCSTAAREARIDGLKQSFGRRCLSERKQQHLINRCRRALRLWIESADGLNLVAEEVDAHRPLHLRSVDVEDPAADRDLAGHLYNVDAGVTDGD